MLRDLRMNKKRRSAEVRWLAKRVKIGTVYLLVSRDKPDLFKIGFTERLTKERRRELERASGEQLTIAYSVSLPWAYATEQRLHKFYRRRLRGSAPELGTEWFRLRRWESLQGVRRRMNSIAKLTEWEARIKLSWGKGIEVRSFTNPNVFADAQK